jgi:uncharacterized protein YecT (DUF1311 family)
MKRMVLAIMALAILTTPAFSEGRGKGSKKAGSDQQTQEQKKKDADLEKAYKDALKKIPDQKSSDPWGNMR